MSAALSTEEKKLLELIQNIPTEKAPAKIKEDLVTFIHLGQDEVVATYESVLSRIGMAYCITEAREIVSEKFSKGSSTNAPVTSKKPPEALTEAPKRPEKVNDIAFNTALAEKYLNLKESARNRNIRFDLSMSDVRNLLRRKRCAYTGAIFVKAAGKPFSCTIDRLDPTVGYVKGNVFAVTHTANSVKNSLFEDLRGENEMLSSMKEIMKMINFLNKNKFKERQRS